MPLARKLTLLAAIVTSSACAASRSPVDDDVIDGVQEEPGEPPPPGGMAVGHGSPSEIPRLTAPYVGMTAGAAYESIAPSLDGPPIFLAGYGGRVGAATGLDASRPITVRALAFADANDTHAVMVALDVVGLDAATVAVLRRTCASTTWLPEAAFTFTATHTHTAPVSRPFPVWDRALEKPEAAWLNETLIAGTVAVVKRAVDGMKPAELRWATGEIPQRIGALPCGNRRGLPYYDRSVDVVEARAVDGSPIATAFFHGCHPVTMGSSTIASADWPADARARIERERGGIAIFFQGFGGDVDPVGITPRADDGKLAYEVGDWIGQAVVSALAEGRTHPIKGKMELLRRTTELALERRASAPKILGPAAQGRWEALMRKEEAAGQLETELETELSSIRFGRLRILMASHEMVGEWAPRIRALFPDEHVMLAGYTDGVDSYVPDDKMVLDLSDKNYEGNVSFFLYGHPGPFAPGADKTLLSLVQTVNGKETENRRPH